ncbi:uncharacterized protein PRCAT00002241001 [Priceomyces carsonii]|uniref:uncharacterized protein n=1 Tax=Priceomyces carsonii TaxID=28549 RepID=UPI002ED9737A|nr:unnamed protein product [Priceomyces carsonii]
MGRMGPIIAISVALRWLLPTVLPNIPFNLSTTVEVCTPINSFKTLQEAFYYLNHGINLYDGGNIAHPPLLVMFLNIFNDLPEPLAGMTFNLIYTLVDINIAYNFIALNKWYCQHNSERTGKSLKGYDDSLIASFYLFNPLVILINLSHSTLVFGLFLLSVSLVQATKYSNLVRSMMALSISGYLSLNLNFLILPILGLYVANTRKSWKLVCVTGIASYLITTSILLWSSYFATSSWSFLNLCYGTVIKFDKISPNLGLWWYMFTEMFDFFTPFYLGVFNIFSVIFIAPFTVRLFEFQNKDHTLVLGDSFLAVVLSYLWLSFTKSYSTVGDLAFALSLIPIFKSTFLQYCRFIYITGLTLLVCLLLTPIFYYSWIVLGNGNSNFFYSLNLIWGAVHALTMIDQIWARVTYDYILDNNISDDKIPTLRLTQI